MSSSLHRSIAFVQVLRRKDLPRCGAKTRQANAVWFELCLESGVAGFMAGYQRAPKTEAGRAEAIRRLVAIGLKAKGK
jgi:hypothetical protein